MPSGSPSSAMCGMKAVALLRLILVIAGARRPARTPAVIITTNMRMSARTKTLIQSTATELGAPPTYTLRPLELSASARVSDDLCTHDVFSAQLLASLRGHAQPNGAYASVTSWKSARSQHPPLDPSQPSFPAHHSIQPALMAQVTHARRTPRSSGRNE